LSGNRPFEEPENMTGLACLLLTRRRHVDLVHTSSALCPAS